MIFENINKMEKLQSVLNKGEKKEPFMKLGNNIRNKVLELKITLIIFLLLFLGVNASSQNTSKIVRPFYEEFKSTLDNGDTIKTSHFISCWRGYENTYGCNPKFTLTQGIKINNSTILYKTLTTPNLKKNGVSIDKSNRKVTVDKNAKMPKYRTFEFVPYSVEIPLNANVFYGNFNCRLEGRKGRIKIIADRFQSDTEADEEKRKLPYIYYTNYNMNVFEYMNKINKIVSRYKIYSHEEDFSINLFKEIVSCQACFDFKNGNSLFDIESRWGIRAFGNILVVIENADEDDMEIFIRIAKSVKKISPDEFDIHDIPNYIEYK